MDADWSRAGPHAWALHEAGRSDEARAAALLYLASDPSELGAHRLAAVASYALDDWGAVTHHAAIVLAARPEEANTLRLYALAMSELRYFEPARRAAYAACRIQPWVWQNHTTVAIVEMLAPGRSRASAAIAHAAAMEAVRLAPDQAGAHATLGRVHLDRGVLPLAEHALRNALALDPQNVAIRQDLAVAQFRGGRTAVAMNEFAALAGTEPRERAHTDNLTAGVQRITYWGLLIVIVWGIGLVVPAYMVYAVSGDDVLTRTLLGACVVALAGYVILLLRGFSLRSRLPLPLLFGFAATQARSWFAVLIFLVMTVLLVGAAALLPGYGLPLGLVLAVMCFLIALLTWRVVTLAILFSRR